MIQRYLFIVLNIVLFSSSCFSAPTDKEKQQEKKLAELIESYSGDEQKSQKIKGIEESNELANGIETTKDIDYSNIKISEDSIDKVLYELIAYSYKVPEEKIIKRIKVLISKGANPNAVITIQGSIRKAGTYIPIIKHFYKNKYRGYTYTSTPFHAAVAKGNIKIVQQLIDLGAKTGIPSKRGDYPIDIAIMSNDNNMIFYLLDHGSDIKKINLGDSKNVDLIEKLVKMGANSKTIDINFALENKTELNRLLSLDPDLQNLELDFKIIFNDDELLDLLLNQGLSIDTKGTFTDNCPLIFGAVKYENLNALKKLIKLGANKSARCRSGFGETPLLLAIHEENADIVEYLLQIGVDPNEKEWTDKSALLNAAEKDNDKVINLLIDAGAQIEYNKYFGKTALMQAVDRKKYISVQALINKGTNVNYETKYGETPLILAIKKNDYPIIKLLVESGAKTNIKYEGKSLVEFAKEKDASPMIIDYLKNK
ncbi:MAG: ankyrin repeat domain-containing protein [Bacteroidota bacterium]